MDNISVSDETSLNSSEVECMGLRYTKLTTHVNEITDDPWVPLDILFSEVWSNVPMTFWQEEDPLDMVFFQNSTL